MSDEKPARIPGMTAPVHVPGAPDAGEGGTNVPERIGSRHRKFWNPILGLILPKVRSRQGYDGSKSDWHGIPGEENRNN